MQALIITTPGSADVLSIQDVRRPIPSNSELLVRVKASGLNRADILQRRGYYPAPPGVPANIPGLEYAGVVEEVGQAVTRFSPGDRVMGLVGGGACADYLVTHEDLALPIPAHLDYQNAAALPEAFITAYDAMVLQGGLKENGTVAITAASSGVGTAAIQIAKELNATTFGSTRTREKVNHLEDLGLTHAVCGEAKELSQTIQDSELDGVDVVLDLVGGPGVNHLIRALRSQGTLVLVGLMGGARADLNLGELLAKRATLQGTVLRSRPNHQKRDLIDKTRSVLLPLFESGVLKPVVHNVFKLDEARAAHIALESNEHTGKIVLDHT